MAAEASASDPRSREESVLACAPRGLSPDVGIVLAVAGFLAGAADDDPVWLDSATHRPVPGPVLGVRGVVLHGRVEPQAVALLAMVEGALERRRLPGAGAPAASAAATAAPLRLVLAILRVGGVVVGGLLRDLLRGLLRGLALRLEGLRHERVILGAQVGLVGLGPGRERLAVAGVGRGQFVLPLEGPDVAHGYVQLVGDPGIGAALAHPCADLIELRLQRSPCQTARTLPTRRPKSTPLMAQNGCPLRRLADTALLAIHMPSAGEKSGVLVLTRKSNQSFMIGDDIEISVLAVMGEKVRIGIEAPRSLPVFRREVYVEIKEEGDESEDRPDVDGVLQALRDTG